MASPLPFLVLFFVMISTKARALNITLNSTLSPANQSSWMSHSGLYAFGFYKKGNGYAVGIYVAGVPQNTVVWTLNRDGPPIQGNATLLFNGYLVLQSSPDEDTIIVTPAKEATSASMLDSGNFVLYNTNHEIVWQSFHSPTDTLLPGQILSGQLGQQLVSSASETDQSTGRFRLKMQRDGNLVQYPLQFDDTAEYSYWSSNTDRVDNVTLHLDQDGHLYLLSNGTVNILNLTNAGYPTKDTAYFLRIDLDGILRLYMHNLTQDSSSSWSVLWESSGDKCVPKGLCGINMFCSTNDQDPLCHCLPGFKPISEGNDTAGCERSFVLKRCNKNTDDGTGRVLEYRMEEVPNTWWLDDITSSTSMPTLEDCKKACLEDCSCEAALFRDRLCRKQKLPMTFGKRELTNSGIAKTQSVVVALIKVGVSIPLGDDDDEDLEPNERMKKRLEMRVVLIGSLVLVSFAFVFLAISGLLFYMNGGFKSYKAVLGNGDNMGLIEDVSLRSFTYAELERVTNNFSEEIGKGSFGTVYKGAMLQINGVFFVAVKKLQRAINEGEREFQNEIKTIGRINHRNLVRLLGYCLDGSNRLLVYEFMSNGSIADVLFKPEKIPPFWEERMEIARNIARGILYLHEECETQIIHCDIKPQNILMDEYGRARISDFGLAKLLKSYQTRTFTGIRGTKGYVAPEWHRKLPITVKADVYSFGIVLLEIICCRRSVDFGLDEEEVVLEEWVHNCFEAGELGKLVGDDQEVDKKQLERVAKVGLWCILDEPSIRPSMKKVLLMLEGTVDIPIPPSPTSFFSTM